MTKYTAKQGNGTTFGKIDLSEVPVEKKPELIVIPNDEESNIAPGSLAEAFKRRKQSIVKRIDENRSIASTSNQRNE